MSIKKETMMRTYSIKLFTVICCLIVTALPVSAKQIPKGLVTDRRIKIVNYDPNNVVQVNTNFGFATTIELQKGEYITYKPGIGKQVGWEIASESYSNLIVVKPTIENNTTNLNFTTNKNRSYTLLLKSSHSPTNMTFRVRYVYDDMRLGLFGNANQTRHIIDKFNSTRSNLAYTFSGDKFTAPICAKDNGSLTVLKFRPGAPIPAILAVDPNTRRESLVNYRTQNGYVIVDGVHPQYTLRYGSHVTCLFNDKALAQWRRG